MAVWKITFVSEHLNADQPNSLSVLHWLHAFHVAVLAIPAVAIGNPEQHVRKDTVAASNNRDHAPRSL